MIVACGNHVYRVANNSPDVRLDDEGFYLPCVACDYKMRLSHVATHADGSDFDVIGLHTPCVDPKTELVRSA